MNEFEWARDLIDAQTDRISRLADRVSQLEHDVRQLSSKLDDTDNRTYLLEGRVQ